ncbi:hypothetical protein NUACC21_31510 [Scytonema sp. NUACC21]
MTVIVTSPIKLQMSTDENAVLLLIALLIKAISLALQAPLTKPANIAIATIILDDFKRR